MREVHYKVEHLLVYIYWAKKQWRSDFETTSDDFIVFGYMGMYTGTSPLPFL